MEFAWQPKRVRIVIVLVTLGLCAYFSARGIGNLAALELLPRRAAPELDPNAHAEIPPLLGENPPDPHAILARNFFDPQTGSLWPPKEQEGPETAGGDSEQPQQEDPAQLLAEGQMPPACEGNLRLVASTYSQRNEDWSFASLSSGSGSPLLYRVGNDIDSKTVSAIFPEAVFLKAQNGSLCSLTMFKSPNQPAKPAAQPTAAPPANSEEAELDQGIQRQSDTKYMVRRSLVDKLLQNQAELMRSARVVPHEENGRVVGVKLYGIRKNSLLGKLGLQNGDMLRTINGFDMGSPDSALEAYAKLRSASNLSVAVVRRGNPVTMEYNIAN